MATLETKENRKTRYTKMALRDSLMELMKDKSILSISIKEICDLADISRSTFYAYYKDQYDLLRQIEDDIFEKMFALVNTEKYPVKYTIRDYIEILEKLLQFIADNKISVQVSLGANGDSAFQKKVFRHVIEMAKVLVPKKVKNHTDAELHDYYSNFAIGGFIAIVQTWINNNTNISVSELVKMILELFDGSAFKRAGV